MKEIFILTKTLLKSSTNDSKKQELKKKNFFSKILLYIIVYGYIIGFMTYISYETISGLILINNPSVFLNISFVGMLGFSVIQTMITSLNLLYFSKDLENLLPLPITPMKIVIAKINCLIISQYVILSLIILPGIIVYGKLLNLEAIYYVVSIGCLLIFPIIPVVIVSGLITIIMKFTKIIKNKEMVQYLSILLSIFLIVIIQVFFTNSENPTKQEMANGFLKANTMIESLYSKLPNIKLILNAISNYNNFTGLVCLIKLLSLSVIIYYAIVLFISTIYVKTVTSLTTVKGKKVKVSTIRKIKSNSVFLTYLKKEIKLLIRTPIFFMQCVLPSIIFPIIIGVPAILSVKESGWDFTVLQQDFGNIINSSLGIIGILVSILFMFIFNYASVTAISRDGENAVFMKYIPLDYKKQIFYKAFPGIVLNIIPTIYIMIFVVIVIPQIRVKTIIYVLLISQMLNVINNEVSILIDLKNPKLKWITEYSVVKQNINMIFVLFLTIFEILFVLWIGNKIKETDNLFAFLISIFLLIYFFIRKYINKHKEEIFEKIN
ncbi:MAG: hypothetical protein IKL55_00550 [Clostridia bacterium]|nr:hypothetical protein [Clostridia bacterium]